MKYFGR